ncbi:hypothetical protein Tco_1447422 [Tanacetum coccineum]
MRTRSQARRRRQPQVRQTSVESSNLEKPDNPPIVTMADNRTMAQLLEAPTEGYEDAIVIPEITANNFEIKHGLLNLVQNKQFFGNDKEDPHAHIRYFNKITSTMNGDWIPEAIYVLEKKCKLHASCSYEHNTQLGKELGVKYGCPMEDVITGLTIKTFKYFYPTTAPWHLSLSKVIKLLVPTYSCGGTIKGWWNDQRMWLYRRLTSYLFAFVDVLLKSMGITNADCFGNVMLRVVALFLTGNAPFAFLSFSLVCVAFVVIMLEADGYEPYLISPEKGLRSLIKGVLEMAKEALRLCVDEVIALICFFMELEDVLGDHRVWMASCVGIDPCTIVMDFEGTHRKSEESPKKLKLSIRVYGENNVVNFIR